MTGIGNGPKIVFEIGSLRITETVVMGQSTSASRART